MLREGTSPTQQGFSGPFVGKVAQGAEENALGRGALDAVDAW